VSSGTWSLEPSAEAAILLPWLLRADVDSTIKARVLEFIADLVRSPDRPLLEDDRTGIYSVGSIPGTDVGIVWLLRPESRQVVIAFVG
jgi:hypothetical protein